MAQRFLHRFSFVFSMLLAFTAVSWADPSAKATFSQESAAVGDSVELQVKISGTQNVRPLDEPRVDGLSLLSMGRSTSFSLVNGSPEVSTTLIYTMQPTRAGTFTVPALRYSADGSIVHTEPVALKVEQNGGNGNSPADVRTDQLLWLELVVPKTSAYVGEILPAELRLYTAVRIGNLQMPTIDGEGFTQTKIPNQPRRSTVQRNGRQYNVFTFEIAISPTKAGKVDVGPVEMELTAQIPRARPNRQRSLFDDFFGDEFFNDPMGPFGQTQQKKITAPAVELNVKPLPTKRRPANFSGAVGQFTLSAQGSPAKVKVGDPITMTVKVNGSGNFDRVSAPTLVDSDGWRSYPPTSNFSAEDPTGTHGEKKFEEAVIPEQKKTNMPEFEFSYFDPTAERYVSLKSGSAPLIVEGEAPPQPPPVTSSNPQASPSAPPPAAEPPPVDIHGIAYDFGKPASLHPLYERPEFWLAQLAPAGILMGALALRLRKPRTDGGRVASLRREKAEQMSRLRQTHDRNDFYDAAVRALQVATAIRTGQTPGAVDASAVCKGLGASPEMAEEIEKMFHARAEAVYAGAPGANGETLPETERQQVLAVLSRMEGGKA